MASAKVLAEAGHKDNALYHCQQSAEKSLKAFLTRHDEPFRRMHDLGEIGSACAVLDPTLRPVTETVDALTDFAWRSRYPGDLYVPAEGESRPCLHWPGGCWRRFRPVYRRRRN